MPAHPDNEPKFDHNTGQWYLPLVGAGAGLIVGVLRILLSYPETPVPQFYDEVQMNHIDCNLAWKTCLLGLVTLSGGLTVGPEAPLGAFGGMLGQYYMDTIEPWILSYDESLLARWGMKRSMGVYAGMAAAFACLFPSPLFAVLILVELGNGVWVSEELWELVVSTALAACSAWVVFVWLAEDGRSYLQPLPGKGLGGYLMGWDTHMMLYSVPLGLAGGLIGLTGIVVVKACEGLVKELKRRLMEKVSRNLAIIVCPMVAGALSGWINVAYPLTCGDGSEQISSVGHDVGDHMILQCSLHYTIMCASSSFNALGIRQRIAISFF
jgi:H+/Cl- antiporter ClcA